MGRRPASEQGDTLAEIRAAAFTLFGRYGYDGVSMLNVARAAGVTKAALYWHYDGKPALYADCMRKLTALFQEHVFARMNGERDPLERLLALFTGIGSLLADHRVREGVAGYWLEPATADVPEARAVQAEFEDTSAALIARSLREAADAGQLDLQISAQDMADAVIATMEAMILPLRRHTPESSRRLIQALAHTFFRAHARGPELVRSAANAVAAGLPAPPRDEATAGADPIG